MSLLQLKDDASGVAGDKPSGDDYTKGSGYILWTSIVAFILVSVGITAFLLADRKPPVAAGEVTEVWAHGVHTLNTPMDANGVQLPGEAYDQILVFAQIRVRNQSDQPIVLKDMLTNVRLEDGLHSSYAASAVDYDRIFIAYPQLAGLHSKTLVRETIVQPDGILEGMIVSSFHVTKEQWAARKDLNFTLQFKLHPDLVLTPKGPVQEQ
jgi:hypothetical protein